MGGTVQEIFTLSDVKQVLFLVISSVITLAIVLLILSNISKRANRKK